MSSVTESFPVNYKQELYLRKPLRLVQCENQTCQNYQTDSYQTNLKNFLPIIPYGIEEVKQWSLKLGHFWVFIQSNNAPLEIKQAYQDLNKHIGFKQNEVTHMKKVSEVLFQLTGWKLRSIPAQITPQEHLTGFANKVFCSTQLINTSDKVTEDYIFNFLGKFIQLANKEIANIIQSLGKMSLGSDNEQTTLAWQIYQSIFANGQILQDGIYKPFCANLLNSLKFEGEFNKFKIGIEYYQQKRLGFYINSLEELAFELKEHIEKDSEQPHQHNKLFSKGPDLKYWKQEKLNLDTYHKKLQKNFDFQTKQEFSFPVRHANFESMSGYLRHYLNNYGDPFQKGVEYNSMRTKLHEQQVVNYLADFYQLPPNEKCWGYMPSGSTESNMQALYFAREHFVGYDHVAVFYTERTHSALTKSLYYLKLQTFKQIAEKLQLQVPFEEQQWPERVPHNTNGSINAICLRKCMEIFAELQIPAIIILTCGTTLESAFDNVYDVVQEVQSLPFYQNGNNLWLHVDAAWCGPYARLLKIASLNQDYNLPQSEIDKINFDFSIPEVRSITTSIHKWIPSPFPSSVLILRNKALLPQNHLKESYIRGYDHTLTTSRNGHAPLFTWDYLMRRDLNDLVHEAVLCFLFADDLYSKMKQVESDLDISLELFHNPLGLNIRFTKPSDQMCYKYGLMVIGQEAIVFVMPDKTEALKQEFLKDLKLDFSKRQGSFKLLSHQMESAFATTRKLQTISNHILISKHLTQQESVQMLPQLNTNSEPH